MHRSFAIAAAGTALALGIVTAIPAMAATGPGKAHAMTRAGARMTSAASKPFQVKAGKDFDVVATVHGVQKGDRLALESYYAYFRGQKASWHVLGSWPMTAGEKNFRGAARSTTPGLFTLRLQFVRKGKLLPGSQSNSFQLRVLGFTVPTLSKPKRAAFLPNATLSDWTSAECATALTVGHGVVIPSPIPGHLNGQELVAQVVWARDAVPGGTYGAWYVADITKQAITQPPADEFAIDNVNDLVQSNQLIGQVLYYPNGNSDEYHQIAWDLAIQTSDGSWVWINPTDWYTPASYIQWDRSELTSFQSANCETYVTAGH